MATKTIQPVKQHKKSSYAVVQERVNVTLELILIGYSRYMIVQYAAKNWGINSRQTDDYISQARKSIDIDIDKERERIKKENIERRIRLIRQAEKAGDFRLTLEVTRDLDKVLGNYPADKLDVKGDININKGYVNLQEDWDKQIKDRSAIIQGALKHIDGDNGKGKGGNGNGNAKN